MKFYNISPPLQNHIIKSGNGYILKQINPLVYLEPEERDDLIKKWEVDKDQKAHSLLFQSKMDFCLRAAFRYSKNYNVPFSDLFQEAMVGLCEGFTRFSLKLELDFSHYIHVWIEQELRKFVFKNYSIVPFSKTKDGKELFFKVNALYRQLSGLSEPLKPFLTDTQVAVLLENSIHQTQNLQSLITSFREPLDINDFVDHKSQSLETDDTDCKLQDCLPSNRVSSEEGLIEEERQKLLEIILRSALKELTPRESYILKQRFLGQKKSLEAIGEEFSLTRERVRQIETSGFKKLYQFFLNLDKALLEDLEISKEPAVFPIFHKNKKIKIPKKETKPFHSDSPILPADSPFLNTHAPSWITNHLQEDYCNDIEEAQLYKDKVLPERKKEISPIPFFSNRVRKAKTRKDISIKELKEAAEKEPKIPVKNRLLGVASLLEGKKGKEAAKIAELSYGSFFLWVKKFNKKGIEGLLPKIRENIDPFTPLNKLLQKNISAQKLYELAQREQNIMNKRRLQAMASLLEGYSFTEVMQKHKISDSSLSRWIRKINEGGVESILEKKIVTTPITRNDLSAAELREIVEEEKSIFVKRRILVIANLIERKPIEKTVNMRVFETWIRRYNNHGVLSLLSATVYRALISRDFENQLEELKSFIKHDSDQRIKKRALGLFIIFEKKDWVQAKLLSGLTESDLYIWSKRYISTGLKGLYTKNDTLRRKRKR